MIKYSNTLGGGGMAVNGNKETYNIAAGQSIKRGDPVKMVTGYNGGGSPIKLSGGTADPRYSFSAKNAILGIDRFGNTTLTQYFVAFNRDGNVYASNYDPSYSDREILVASAATLKSICYLSWSIIVFYTLSSSPTTLRAKYVSRNLNDSNRPLYTSSENVIASSATGDCTALGLGSNDFVVSYVVSGTTKYIKIARYTIMFTNSLVTSLSLISNALQFASYTSGYTSVKPISNNGMLYLQYYGDTSYGHDLYYMLVIEGYGNSTYYYDFYIIKDTDYSDYALSHICTLRISDTYQCKNAQLLDVFPKTDGTTGALNKVLFIYNNDTLGGVVARKIQYWSPPTDSSSIGLNGYAINFFPNRNLSDSYPNSAPYPVYEFGVCPLGYTVSGIGTVKTGDFVLWISNMDKNKPKSYAALLHSDYNEQAIWITTLSGEYTELFSFEGVSNGFYSYQPNSYETGTYTVQFIGNKLDKLSAGSNAVLFQIRIESKKIIGYTYETQVEKALSRPFDGIALKSGNGAAAIPNVLDSIPIVTL